MSNTPEPDNTKGRSSAWHWFAWTFVILLIAYPLSIGPVLRLEVSGVIPDSAERRFEHFYSPLRQLYKHSDAAKHFLDWYVQLWNPEKAPR